MPKRKLVDLAALHAQLLAKEAAPQKKPEVEQVEPTPIDDSVEQEAAFRALLGKGKRQVLLINKQYNDPLFPQVIANWDSLSDGIQANYNTNKLLKSFAEFVAIFDPTKWELRLAYSVFYVKENRITITSPDVSWNPEDGSLIRYEKGTEEYTSLFSIEEYKVGRNPYDVYDGFIRGSFLNATEAEALQQLLTSTSSYSKNEVDQRIIEVEKYWNRNDREGSLDGWLRD